MLVVGLLGGINGWIWSCVGKAHDWSEVATYLTVIITGVVIGVGYAYLANH